MELRAARCLLYLSMAAPMLLSAQRPPQPLFATDSVLEVRIEADLKKVFRERTEDSKPYPATVTLPGGGAAIPAQIQTRGNFRLRRSTCVFPPLRLRFAKDVPAMAGTPFAGQRKLKLVTHCQPGDAFQENVVEEYLVYRAYNAITDSSFRVRLARVTYVDQSDPKADPVTRYAVFIEDDDGLAERLGGKSLNMKRASPMDVDPELLAVAGMFQYMIGNTDWALSTLHNVRLVRTADDRIVPILYDFDWSALVGAPYARPDPSLPTKTIYERYYMGICLPVLDLQPLAKRFNGGRDRIYALYRDSTILDPKAGERTIKYLDEFYETLNDPKKAKRVFGSRC